MNFLRNLSIRKKLLLVSLIPLVALSYFLTVDIITSIGSKSITQQVYDDVIKAEALSDVIHQIQQERGHSLGYLISTGKEEKTDLFTQREKTDKAIFNLRKILVKQDTGKQVQSILRELITYVTG